MIKSEFGLGLLLFISVLLTQQPALACGLAFRGYAETTAEEALVIWNPNTKVEHLIRRAQFKTAEQTIGFLVPTPNVPELNEIDQAVFSQLHAEIQPRQVVDYILIPSLLYALVRPNYIGSRDRAMLSQPDVQVLQQKNVAGYQASVLKSQQADSVLNWLKQNNYPVRPALKAWLQPYLKKGWVMTAFQLNQQHTEQTQLNLKALDIRFVTDKPFYPYREPEDAQNREHDRSLRLYFIGPQPVNGEYSPASGLVYDGEDQHYHLSSANHPIQEARRLYSAPLDKPQHQALIHALPAADLPSERWLSSWLDLSNQRLEPIADQPNEISELYFRPAVSEPYLPIQRRDQTIILPVDICLIAGWIIWRRKQRKTKLSA